MMQMDNNEQERLFLYFQDSEFCFELGEMLREDARITVTDEMVENLLKRVFEK